MQDETQEVQNEEVSADAKAAEYLAGWKRAQADYTNLQKEVAVQRAEMGKHATAEVVLGFLPVYDYFKRALAHQPLESEQSASVKNWFIGTLPKSRSMMAVSWFSNTPDLEGALRKNCCKNFSRESLATGQG